MLIYSGAAGKRLYRCYFRSVCMADMAANLEKVEYANMLYDFYGPLLNDSQSEVMSMYHEDNLSLSEIAEELGQSRQAVHYTLKKAEKALNEYEEKLGLLKTYERNRELADEAADLIRNLDGSSTIKERLTEIIGSISE